jgi:hypothetical protein
MELSPQEQSFFDAGDALSGPRSPVAQAQRRRRHSHRHSRHSIRTALRGRTWRRKTATVVLTVVAVMAGYWVSMQVINRDIPNAADFGIGLH